MAMARKRRGIVTWCGLDESPPHDRPADMVEDGSCNARAEHHVQQAIQYQGATYSHGNHLETTPRIVSSAGRGVGTLGCVVLSHYCSSPDGAPFRADMVQYMMQSMLGQLGGILENSDAAFLQVMFLEC
jgi:hypothetical protein